MIGRDPVQRFFGEAQRQRFRRRHLQGVGQASREVAGSRLDCGVPLGREALGGLVEVLALGPVGDEPQQRAAQRHGQHDLEEEAGEAVDRVGQRERDDLREQERDGRERDRTGHDTARSVVDAAAHGNAILVGHDHIRHRRVIGTLAGALDRTGQ